MDKIWHVQPQDSALVSSLERSAQVPTVVAQLLVSRGVIDNAAARLFLDASLSGLLDPERLPGVTEAADRIHAAIKSNRRIIIYGDYDADGMTATALLYRCLSLLGANVGYFIPSRLDEGYGLSVDSILKLASHGASMIISVDCGVSSVREAQAARDAGVELIITDHHQFGSELPCAAAIVHPCLPGHAYPFAGLCGAGVALKLAWALCQRASEAKRVTPRLRKFLLSAVGIASIGTVADVVPLLDENRVIVKHGLRCLKADAPLGIQCLMRLSKLDKLSELRGEDVAFMIAPRLNAAGRLGQAQLGVELMTTEDPVRANSLAEYLDELNNSRASLERKIYLAAHKQLKENFDPEHEPALVLAGRGWHKGVIGIVAGRLAEKYHRPVVMIAQDELSSKPAVGSARSVPGVNLHAALASCSDHLEAHGGHAAAAGLTINDCNIDRFRAEFCERISEQFSPELRKAELTIDTEAPFSSMTLKTVRQIESLAPFGQSNPRPVFCTTGVKVAGRPKAMGKGDRHASLALSQHGVQLRAIAFNQAEWVEQLPSESEEFDIVYRPVLNEFAGRRSVELQLVDWRRRASVPDGPKVA